MPESKEMVVILTGASRGIGLSTAHHLLTNSHKVLLISRTQSALTTLQDQYGSTNVDVLAGDCADFSLAQRALDRALEKWGRVDALVLNHGTLEPVNKVADSGVEEWRRAFDTNVFGCVAFVQAALPSLRKTRGRIIFTSSGAAQSAYQGWGAYGAGKAVLNHLAATLGVEEPDVTTLSIRPGVVDTAMQTDIRSIHASAMSASDRAKFSGLKENGNLLRPEQPGNVIARLAVEDGDDVRGLSGEFLSWDDGKLGKWQSD